MYEIMFFRTLESRFSSMADTTIMRRNNLQTILQAIDQLGTATTADLTEHTLLSLATISRVTGQLKNKGLILQDRKQTSDPGRKPEVYQLNRTYGAGLYFNLKSGCLQGYLLDFGGKLLAQTEDAVNSSLTVASLMQLLLQQRSKLISKNMPRPLAVCLSLPGQQDRQTDTVCRIPNFPQFEGCALQTAAEAALGLPCLIANTARLTAWGHFLARPNDVQNLIFLEITGDCGIGAGLVLGGRLYEDALGLAGEVGDMIVQLGSPSKSPTRGALEEESGIVTILTKAEKLLPSETALSLPLLEQLAPKKDAVMSLLQKATRAWAAAIINLCAVLSPDLIAVGGAISKDNSLICKLIREHLQTMYHRPIALSFAPANGLYHTEGAGDLLKSFLFSRELDRIDE